MTEARARDKSVDFAKGIAMIAVSFGHIMPVLYGKVDIVSKYGYSFELAVFFIVSGYLQFGRIERESLDYIKHNSLSLLYPYAMFTATTFLADSLLYFLANGFDLYVQNLPRKISSIITWGAQASWFFPTFLISGIIAYFCRKDTRFSNVLKILFLIITGSLMSFFAEKYGYLRDATTRSIITLSFWLWHLFSLLSRCVVGASLVMVGYELKKSREKVRVRSMGGGIALSTILIVFGFLTAYLNYDFVDIHLAFIRNPILFYASAISTTYALLLIGQKFHPACIVWCGQESLLLILAQTGIAYISLLIKNVINNFSWPYMIILALSIMVLMVSIAISYFAIKLIHATFLKILIIPPGKREDK